MTKNKEDLSKGLISVLREGWTTPPPLTTYLLYLLTSGASFTSLLRDFLSYARQWPNRT